MGSRSSLAGSRPTIDAAGWALACASASKGSRRGSEVDSMAGWREMMVVGERTDERRNG